MNRQIVLISCLFLTLATRPSFALEPEKRGLQIYCGESLLSALTLPRDGRSNAQFALVLMLANADNHYFRIVRGLHRRGLSAPTDEKEMCKIEAYRLRANEFGHLRRELETDYDKAVENLKIAESNADANCKKHSIKTKAWAVCETKFSKERSALKSSMFKAKRVWERISNPPNYDSLEFEEYLMTNEEVNRNWQTLVQQELMTRPKYLGSEVWCGSEWVRQVGRLASPVDEFFDVIRLAPISQRKVLRLQASFDELAAWKIEPSRLGESTILKSTISQQNDRLIKSKTDLANWQCKRDWLLVREVELAGVPKQVDLEFNTAQKQFDDLSQACEAKKPKGEGWVKYDSVAQEWDKCRSDITPRKNKAAKRLRNAKSYSKALKRALVKRQQQG